jgi:hypothetical protein
VDAYQEFVNAARGTFSGTPLIEGPVSGGTRMRIPIELKEAAELLEQLPGRARQYATQPGGLFVNQAGAFRQAAGGRSSALLSGLGTFTQDPVAGVISTPIGVVSGGLANKLTTKLTEGMLTRGPAPLKATAMALRFLAPAMIGTGVQQATAQGVQSALGTTKPAATPSTGGGGGGGLFGVGGALQDLTIPVPFLGSVAIGERKKREREAAYGREQRKEDAKLEMELLQQQTALDLQNQIAGQRALADINTQTYVNQLKAMQPILADARRQELAGQQALLNTQGAIYQKLGRMSGMFQLADRSMAETGALARTMAANSPYNAAILPAPQISFGR